MNLILRHSWWESGGCEVESAAGHCCPDCLQLVVAGRHFSIVAAIASSSCACSVTKFAITFNLCLITVFEPLADGLSFVDACSCSELGSASQPTSITYVILEALPVLIELSPTFVRDVSTVQFIITATVNITTTTDTYTADSSCFPLGFTDFSTGHRVGLSQFSYFEPRKWQPINEAIKVIERHRGSVKGCFTADPTCCSFRSVCDQTHLLGFRIYSYKVGHLPRDIPVSNLLHLYQTSHHRDWI